MSVLGFCWLLIALYIGYAAADYYHSPLPESRNFKANAAEETTQFWVNQAQSLLTQKLQQQSRRNTNRAKNIILFLGDGMSVHTLTATRAFLGDSSEELYFENFPYTGLSKTYAVDKRVPDSAATSTAYLSGVKANYGTIGVNAKVAKYDCEAATDAATHTESIAKWAQDAGMWTGLVTTARVTHASPAGVYAHSASRTWEHDAEIVADGCSPVRNVDIARQLLEWPVGKELRVVLGGGRRNFLDESMEDEDGEPGRRTDGRNLIAEWLASKRSEGKRSEYVYDKQGLEGLDLTRTDYLLGLFASSHCPYHGDLERDNLEEQVPSLTEMTEAAINLLSRHTGGYFLFVEGAKIDMAHHDTRAHRSLEDTAEFARAVELARQMTNEADTLIVVTSDHAHTMTINGAAERGANIFGLANKNADDGLPYTILSYANGPGFSKTFSSKTGRKNLNEADLDDPKYKYMAAVPLESETHGADDVGVFASGPYEHYFSGNYEQTTIPALMAYAANIGPFTQANINSDAEA